MRATLWRLSEFSKEQPQYFALVFLDRHVPRVSREYERFSIISEIRNRALSQVERCIAEGVFPATTHAEVALRLLFAPILGIAALRVSNRTTPEDADALVRDAIETTIAGIRAGAPTTRAAFGLAQCSRLNAQCSTSGCGIDGGRRARRGARLRVRHGEG